jgi:hypothetical protein
MGERLIFFEGFLDTHDVAKLLLNIDYFIHQLGVSTINGPPFGISNHFAEFAKRGGLILGLLKRGYVISGRHNFLRFSILPRFPAAGLAERILAISVPRILAP